ncbi:group 1 glycosyl transferase [Hapalosiphon sp. MRB220]|nr:group 1 glycosyl transferase [Hapalosiphon sp. MRB220]
MKLYLYLKHFPPEGDNLNEGTTKAVHGLASGLANCGADVTILCEGIASSSFQAQSGYKIECFANDKHKHPSFKIATDLKDYINNLSRDSLVILNGIFHRSVYSLSQFLRKTNISYIVAPHDPYHPSIFQKNAYLKLPYWYLLEQRMLKQAQAVQILDIRHAQWLRNLGIHTPVIATPNGFFPDDVYPESTIKWEQNGKQKLFFLGRLDSYNKGLDILLDGFAETVKVADFQLTIQGPDWGDKKALQEQTDKLGLSERVTFLEPDYNQSPSLLIAKHDIFCIPSRFEGFSLAAIEAMLAGRVLLISEVAGIAPHVEASGCGIVVKPEPSSLKAGLMELLERHTHWQEMGLKGRRYALEYLRWDAIASKALQEYEHLLLTSNRS